MAGKELGANVGCITVDIWLDLNTSTSSCDAEPEVLSNYVLALLKHDAPESELRETFQKQLHDFLDNGMFALVCVLYGVLIFP